MDVTSLYSNIPKKEDLQAVRMFLEEHRLGPVKPSNDTLLELLTHILELNNFQFNGESLIQVVGTAMGTRVMPSFANIFMAEFEKMFMSIYPVQPQFYKRYIEDCVALSTHGQEELDKWIACLNQCYPSIKFTVDQSEEKNNFLDTTINIDRTSGTMWTDLYSKPTDSLNYLHCGSAHPAHSNKGLPFSQFLCVRWICSWEEDFMRHC